MRLKTPAAETPNEWIINLLDNLGEVKIEKKISVHHHDRVKLVRLSDIICLEAENNYTHIFTSDDQKYTPARVLKYFEGFLEKYRNFIRISKKAIVNLDYITEYSKGEPHILFMQNGKEYEVGRRVKTELIERIR